MKTHLFGLVTWLLANLTCSSLLIAYFASHQRNLKKLVFIFNIKQQSVTVCDNNNILHYILVSGCSDDVSGGAFGTGVTTTRTGDEMVIRCRDSKEVWYLTCSGNTWIGERGNCSTSKMPRLCLKIYNEQQSLICAVLVKPGRGAAL